MNHKGQKFNILNKVIISRVDQIGDVILTLPLCGFIKAEYPKVKIIFVCQPALKPILKRCGHIDEILLCTPQFKKLPQADAILHVFPQKRIASIASKSTYQNKKKEAKIKIRIGTNRRWFHWLYCNQLVNLTRKNSSMHESELNIKLLQPLGIQPDLPVHKFWYYYGWKKQAKIERQNIKKNFFNQKLSKSLPKQKKNHVIFHIKSRGSGKEWNPISFFELAKKLPANKFTVYLTGTLEEGKLIHKEIPEIFKLDYVFDVTGRFSLEEFICFIESCDGLLSTSTGPLHIAAASGIYAIGLFSNVRPIHAGRWGPIGKKAHYLSEDKNTFSQEAKQKPNNIYLNISVERVLKKICTDFKINIA